MAKWILVSAFLLISWGAAAADASLDKELLYRLRFSNAEDVQLLLDHGANPNATTEDGVPALTAAFERTDNKILDVVKMLIAKGANVNAGGGAGRPPLIEAVKTGDFAMVKYLVEQAKADIHVRDAEQYDPLTRAREFSRNDMAAYLGGIIAAEKPLKPNTPEFKAKQTRLLAASTCARQYYSFYYKSKQDPIPEATQKAALNKLEKEMREAAGDLMQIFKIEGDVIQTFQERIARGIGGELNDLISNRNRRAKGVGKEEDMKKRCEKIIASVTLKENRR